MSIWFRVLSFAPTSFFLAIILLIQSISVEPAERRLTYLAPPPESIERFTFGFAESTADSLWLRWIQDGDTCRTFAGVKPAALEIDHELEKEYSNPRHRLCDTSWSYKMLDAVTKVAPKFKMPYLAGGMTLAVLVEDYEGSTRIFERAVENYPDDWQILFRSAYHYLFDLKDLPRAAELLDRAAEHGAPSWLRLLAARINTRAGRAALGLTNLKRYLDTLTEPEARRNVEKRIADLEREMRQAPKPDGP